MNNLCNKTNALVFRCSETELYLSALASHFNDKNIKPRIFIDFPESITLIEKYFDAPCLISWHETSRTMIKNHFVNGYKHLNSSAIQFASKYFPIAIDIMHRFKRKGSFTPQENMELYYAMLENAFDLLLSNEIKNIYFHDIPHHFDSISIYVVAKYLNIPTFILSPNYWRQTRFSIDINIEDRGWSIKNNFSISSEIDVEDGQYRNRLQKPFAGYIEPKYMRFQLKNKNIALRLISLVFSVDGLAFQTLLDIYRMITRGPFQRYPYHTSWSRQEFYNESPPINLLQFWHGFTQRLRIIQLEKFYKKRCCKKMPDRFVLFTPNYQPEATTQPSAGYYSSIIVCLLSLRAKLPPDTVILFKEHNSCFDLRNEAYLFRSKNFYKKILEVNNVRFAPANISPAELIEKSILVVTQTSTIALEASLKKKITITFGSAWFNNLEYILNWREVENMEDISVLANVTDVGGVRTENKILDNFNRFTFRNLNVTDPQFKQESRKAATLLSDIYEFERSGRDAK